MTAIALFALAAWVWLLLFHDRFWQSGPVLAPAVLREAASVDVVVPARNEAETIGEALASLLAQDYPGRMRILMVDDGSTDGTAAIAGGLGDGRLAVVAGTPTPPGWSGKLWAMAQGVGRAEADFLLLTDADIVHAPGHLAALAAKATGEKLDLVSEMVALRCESFAERALVPAFVYFFQLLFPFAAVNDPRRPIAAAAGGSMLVRRAALERAGGIAAIKGALIDDVALARAIKRGGPDLARAFAAGAEPAGLSRGRRNLADDRAHGFCPAPFFSGLARGDGGRDGDCFHRPAGDGAARRGHGTVGGGRGLGARGPELRPDAAAVRAVAGVGAGPAGDRRLLPRRHRGLGDRSLARARGRLEGPPLSRSAFVRGTYS